MLGTGISNNLNQKQNQFLAGGGNNWKFGLYSCCGDILSCCCACYIPCFVQGKTYALLNESDSSTKYTCAFFLADVLGCGLCATCYLRGKVRESRDIDGNGCGDFCSSLFCGPCVMVQAYRELKK
ncbi:hypothetical protein MHBO_004891 [Bonamia ostreae]|uniref:Uncharacterized protein n=1 Tax=Bonamia ostreae TaxID=126728 RepID=A0ABV2AVC4_9EUKA